MKASSDRKETSLKLSHLRTLQTLSDDPPSLQFCQPSWMHERYLCVAFLKNKSFMHSAQVVIHYMGQPKW